LVAVYEAIEPLAEQSPVLRAVLERYQPDYQLAQDFLIRPDHRLADVQDARAAFDGSAIAAIDGNVIRGTRGEKLDLSANTMRLSLEGAGGLELNVGTINRPDTRGSVLEISRKRQNIQVKEVEIARLSSQTEQLGALIDQLKSETSDRFATEEDRALLIRGLLRQFTDMSGLTAEMERFETGAEFLKGLITFLVKAKGNSDSLITIHKAEIATLRKDIGVLQAKIDTKRALAAENLRTRKERAMAARAFYERV